MICARSTSRQNQVDAASVRFLLDNTYKLATINGQIPSVTFVRVRRWPVIKSITDLDHVREKT